MRSPALLLVASCASLVCAQTFPDEASLPGCGESCLDNLIGQTATFGCAGGSADCLCAVPDFTNGVHDCAANACAADLFPSVTNYMYSVCASVTAAAVPATSVATSVWVPTSSALPADTAVISSVAAVPTSVAASSTFVPVVSSAIIVPGLVNATSAAGAASTAAPLASSSAASADGSQTTETTETTDATTTPTSTGTSTSSSTSSASSTAAASSSLSAGAKAGIGIGAAVGVVAVIAGLAALCVARKRSMAGNNGGRHVRISEPMPGAGRVYANDESVSELEMKSRRYEDMVPRHAPRNMV